MREVRERSHPIIPCTWSSHSNICLLQMCRHYHTKAKQTYKGGPPIIDDESSPFRLNSSGNSEEVEETRLTTLFASNGTTVEVRWDSPHMHISRSSSSSDCIVVIHHFNYLKAPHLRSPLNASIQCPLCVRRPAFLHLFIAKNTQLFRSLCG